MKNKKHPIVKLRDLRWTEEHKEVMRKRILEGCIYQKWDDDYCLMHGAYRNVADVGGYTQIHVRGPEYVNHIMLAHRLMYMLTIGEIPDGMILHHTCGNKECCRTEHLVPMPQGQHRTMHAKMGDI